MQELTFLQGFMRRVERDPGRSLVIDDAASYAEHLTRVVRLASAMAGLGIGPEDHFAVLARNSHRHLELWHAAFLGGGVITPLNVRLAVSEIVFMLRDARVGVCFVDGEFAALVPQLADLAGLRIVVGLERGQTLGTLAYEDFIDAGEERQGPEPADDRITALMYTGGTTGRPKAVMLSGRALLLNQYRILMAGPLPEAGGSCNTRRCSTRGRGGVLRAPLSGGTVVMLPAFEAEAFMTAVHEHQVQHTVLVPSMISRILEHPAFRKERLATLRRIHYGGSPISPQLLRSVRALYPELELIQSYGIIEASSNATQLSDAEHRGDDRYLQSVGRALPGVRIQIRALDGRPCEPGEVGESACAAATR